MSILTDLISHQIKKIKNTPYKLNFFYNYLSFTFKNDNGASSRRIYDFHAHLHPRFRVLDNPYPCFHRVTGPRRNFPTIFLNKKKYKKKQEEEGKREII